MKIASWATPEGLAGHSLSTTGLRINHNHVNYSAAPHATCAMLINKKL